MRTMARKKKGKRLSSRMDGTNVRAAVGVHPESNVVTRKCCKSRRYAQLAAVEVKIGNCSNYFLTA